MPSKSCNVTVDLGGAPRALVELRSGGAAVDVGADQLGVHTLEQQHFQPLTAAARAP
jgi:hypothetical protein